MNAQNKHFGRQRVLTTTEKAALGYQSQGSYPSGLKNVRSYALRSALKFIDCVNSNEIQLFSAPISATSKFDTNVLSGNTIPQGQALLVHSIDFNLTTPITGDVAAHTFDQDNINAFANFMRNTIFTFGRENAQWDAQFLGSEVLPSVFGMTTAAADAGAAAPVRVGDFVRPAASFRLKVPVVIGQNTSFNFTAQLKALLAAANPLVANNEDMVVQLRGILTKMAAV